MPGKEQFMGLVALGCLAGLACVAPRASTGCTKDVDCAAGRICVQGSCQSEESESAGSTMDAGADDGADGGGDGGDGSVDTGRTTASDESADDASDETAAEGDTGFEGEPIAGDCFRCLDESDADNRTVTCSLGVEDIPMDLVFSGDRPVSFGGMPCADVQWDDVFTESCFGSLTCGSCSLDLSFAGTPNSDPDWDVIFSCDGNFGGCPVQADTPVANGPECLNCGDDGHYCDGAQLRRCTDGEVAIDCTADECRVDNVIPTCYDRDHGLPSWIGSGCYGNSGTDASCVL